MSSYGTDVLLKQEEFSLRIARKLSEWMSRRLCYSEADTRRTDHILACLVVSSRSPCTLQRTSAYDWREDGRRE